MLRHLLDSGARSKTPRSRAVQAGACPVHQCIQVLIRGLFGVGDAPHLTVEADTDMSMYDQGRRPPPHLEGWASGLCHLPAKEANEKSFREFESLSFRQTQGCVHVNCFSTILLAGKSAAMWYRLGLLFIHIALLLWFLLGDLSRGPPFFYNNLKTK